MKKGKTLLEGRVKSLLSILSAALFHLPVHLLVHLLVGLVHPLVHPLLPPPASPRGSPYASALASSPASPADSPLKYVGSGLIKVHQCFYAHFTNALYTVLLTSPKRH